MDSVPFSPATGNFYDSGQRDIAGHLRIGYEAMKTKDLELRELQDQWLKGAQDLFIQIQSATAASTASVDANFVPAKSVPQSVVTDGSASGVSVVPRVSKRSSSVSKPYSSETAVSGVSIDHQLQHGDAVGLKNSASWRFPQSSTSNYDQVRRLSVRQAARKRTVEKLKEAASIKSEDVHLTPCCGGGGLWQVLRTVKAICKRVEAHYAFQMLVFAAIFTNVILTGIELDYLANAPDKRGQSDTFDMIQSVYTGIFCGELVIRLVAHGRFFLLHERDWTWNVFDLVVVGGALVETFASKHVDMSHFRIIRVMRATRLVRSVRIVRMIRFIRALRSLILSIMMSLRQVVWSVLLLLIIIFSFSVAFVQAVVDQCSQSNSFRSDLVASGCDDANLAKFWGTIPRAMFTLFMSITGGVSWNDATYVLGLVSPIWLFMFLVYVTFTAFAVLNVVTAVFCQSAMESVQLDREQATMQLLANKGSYLDALDKLFEDMDADHSGAITLTEFEEALQREDVILYLESLELSMDDAWHLFKILDADSSGFLDKQEFIMGCIQLKGGAKAVDIAKMSYDSRLADSIIESNIQRIEEEISKLRSAITLAVDGLRGLPSKGSSCSSLKRLINTVDL